MQYSETELAKLIETVEKEFTVHLNKAEEAHASLAKSEVSASGTMAKAEDSKPPKKEESKDKEAKAPESQEAAPAEGESEEAAPAEAAPAAEGAEQAPPAEGQPPAAAPAAAGAGHGYDEEDMAHMLKMYQSMSREELLAHHDCVRQCLDAMGAEQAPSAEAGAPAPGMDKCGQMTMGKSEIEDENPELNSKPKAGGKDMNGDAKNGGIEGQAPSGPKGARSEASKDSKNLHDAMSKTERQERNGGKITDSPVRNSPGAKSPASNASKAVQMEKSENVELELVKSELAAEQAKSADLKKSFDKATELLTNLVKKVVPQGKAITSLDVIAKSEGGQEASELSKSEVTQILMKKDQTKLTKNDREAINSYYLGSSDLNTISHLLKN